MSNSNWMLFDSVSVLSELSVNEKFGNVYVLEIDDCVKIGRSSNVYKRLKSLSGLARNYMSAEPGRVLISRSCTNYAYLEKQLHYHFNNYKLNKGELFTISFDTLEPLIYLLDLYFSEKIYIHENSKIIPPNSQFFLKLQGGTHHKVGYLLLDYQNSNNDEIEITKSVKEKISKVLDIKPRMVEKSIQELVEANILTPVTRGSYLLNPLFIYKGGTVDLENRVTEYNKLRGDYEHQHKQTAI